MTRRGGRPDAGSASVWVLALAALVLALAVAVELRTVAVLARHRVEAAADLAALAAAGAIGTAAAPCAGAAEVAAANHGVLTACVLRVDASGRSGQVWIQVTSSFRLVGAGRCQVVGAARAVREPGAGMPDARRGERAAPHVTAVSRRALPAQRRAAAPARSPPAGAAG
jgi:secretion/DNA translocation related TadE-like protein